MRKMLSIVLAMVLLASAVPLAITPAAAIYPYEEKIPGDVDENGELTKAELSNAILSYMLGEEDPKLDDAGDASYVYAYWDGKPKRITDQYGRPVTFYRPIERVISLELPSDRIIVAVDRFDRLVGAEGGCRDVPSPSTCVGELQFAYGGKISEVEKVRSNVELIASLRPDVIFSSSRTADVLQEQTGAPVVVPMPSRTLTMSFLEWWSMQIECIGEVLERDEEAEDISFMEEKLALVTDITSQIDDSEKPRVYYAARASSPSRGGFTKTAGHYDPIDLAGGLNVAREDAATSGEFSVSKEQIIKWNPDIMVLKSHKTNPSLIESVILDPLLQAGNVNAVKNGTVYYCMATCRHYPIQRYIPETMYLAKIFHPEKFKDLDLEKEGNEIMKKFFGEDGIYTWTADDHGYIRDIIENPPEEGEW